MIYMDNASMTKPTNKVVGIVAYVMNYAWYNPSSAHSGGKKVKRYIDDARKNVAKMIGAKPEEIHFTSGATESANILINSLVAHGDVYITNIEHPCVTEAGVYNVGYLPVDKDGLVYTEHFPMFNEAREDGGYTTLFVIAANNEVGTIQPLGRIGEICKNRDFLLASDLTQAYGHIPINVKDLNISFAFGSGQKIGGLSGCGWLYVDEKYNDLISPLCVGGMQDMFKSGTENITGIVALGEATKEALENMEENEKVVTELRDYMIGKITSEIPDTVLIGHRWQRLPNNVCIGFGDCDSESIVQYLDMYDIYASAGSACHTNSVEPSSVLRAMRLPSKYINGAVRFTLSADNTKDEIDYVVSILGQCCEQMRKERMNKK